jgi:hypothetical protein
LRIKGQGRPLAIRSYRYRILAWHAAGFVAVQDKDSAEEIDKVFNRLHGLLSQLGGFPVTIGQSRAAPAYKKRAIWLMALWRS